MSDPTTKKKSFFSGLAGVITGLAGVASAIVAVVGLSVSQGWIGHKSSTTSAGAPTNAGVVPGSGDAGPQFSVDPARINFESLGPRNASVTVHNTGTVKFAVKDPTVTGPDADRFDASMDSCSDPIAAGRSCGLTVTFKPKSGTFNATLVVEVEGGLRAVEVPIRAQALL